MLPFWLAPKQLTVIPATNHDDDLEYASKINQKLFALGFRSKIDLREERLNKKIREAQISKSKIQLILGEKEHSSNTITYREYGKDESITMPLDEFITYITNLKQTKK